LGFLHVKIIEASVESIFACVGVTDHALGLLDRGLLNILGLDLLVLGEHILDIKFVLECEFVYILKIVLWLFWILVIKTVWHFRNWDLEAVICFGLLP